MLIEWPNTPKNKKFHKIFILRLMKEVVLPQ